MVLLGDREPKVSVQKGHAHANAGAHAHAHAHGHRKLGMIGGGLKCQYNKVTPTPMPKPVES